MQKAKFSRSNCIQCCCISCMLWDLCCFCPQIKRRLEQQRQEVLRRKQELAREHEQVATLQVLCSRADFACHHGVVLASLFARLATAVSICSACDRRSSPAVLLAASTAFAPALKLL